jgi:hypothetical protein
MDREEGNRLDGGILTCNAQPQRLEYSEETENKCGEGKIQMRRRRADGSPHQYERNAGECDEYSCCAETLHV